MLRPVLFFKGPFRHGLRLVVGEDFVLLEHFAGAPSRSAEVNEAADSDRLGPAENDVAAAMGLVALDGPRSNFAQAGPGLRNTAVGHVGRCKSVIAYAGRLNRRAASEVRGEVVNRAPAGWASKQGKDQA